MENVLCQYLEKHFDEVTPQEFYRNIFPSGELEKKGQYVDGEYTGILVAVTDQRKPTGQKKIKRYCVTDDLEVIDEAVKSDYFCLLSPLSYAGKQRTAENARYMYAMAVDLDRIQMRKDGSPLGLENLWERHIQKLHLVPCPTFIVSSGTGLHLYYVFKEPIPLYQNIAKELQNIKRRLTSLIWNETITNIESWRDIQQEGIYQGFRVVGTVTKVGTRARAFRTGDRVDIEYIYSFMGIDFQNAQTKELEALRKKKKRSMSLSEAKEKYPDWYQERILENRPRKFWAVNRSVYDWWKRQILQGATVGHRYFCIMALAIYAKKCSHYDAEKNPNPVTREELEHDAFGLLDFLDSRTDDENNPFTTDDILAALEAFDDRLTFYPRDAIEYRTSIIIPKRKRNGRKRDVHLQRLRALEEVDYPDGSWRNKNGRPSSYEAVQKWRELHPDGKKIDCQRETGISRPTILKHWERHFDEGKNNK